MHPSYDITGSKTDKLSGKLIILGVTGSIAAVETVKLARELLRHGAEVQPVMSPSACKIIHPDALEFAAGKKPITELTGATEHVSYCGDVEGSADLLLIAPATANTISKIVQGIDDTPVTTFAATALGTGIPILIVPAMHGTMYDNEFVKKSVETLSTHDDVELIGPRIDESKAKIAEIDEITARVIRRVWKSDLKKKKVLIVAGSTAEPVDDFRILTNRSSGKMGIELANSAFQRGADVTLWYGASPAAPPAYIYTESFRTVDELFSKMSFLDFDVTVVCAAIADYSPEKKQGKIPSGQTDLSIRLRPTPKVLSAIRDADSSTYLVGFKAEYDASEPDLIEKAFGRLEKLKLDMIVANDLKEVTDEHNHIFILKSNRERAEVKGSKAEVADKIFDEIVLDLISKDELMIGRD